MLDPVTFRYAEALFGLAQKTDALTEVSADVRHLARELAAPAAAWFFDARVPIDDRRQSGKIQPIVWCTACGATLTEDDLP